ncbi:zinc ribbon domain-containing protein [Oscillatoria salina]|uniref:zinc ribbon domain-containing protein n=1 Tax=Oscillatoria salina TaxID=331517 RepID=UPI0029621CA4|nr:zinc ribbon domain-containing protein [Oscillatoria salina]
MRDVVPQGCYHTHTDNCDYLFIHLIEGNFFHYHESAKKSSTKNGSVKNRTAFTLNHSSPDVKKFNRRGVFVGEVNHKGTSQTCPNCGITVRKEHSDRVHSCPECQYEEDVTVRHRE